MAWEAGLAPVLGILWKMLLWGGFLGGPDIILGHLCPCRWFIFVVAGWVVMPMWSQVWWHLQGEEPVVVIQG